MIWIERDPPASPSPSVWYDVEVANTPIGAACIKANTEHDRLMVYLSEHLIGSGSTRDECKAKVRWWILNKMVELQTLIIHWT